MEGSGHGLEHGRGCGAKGHGVEKLDVGLVQRRAACVEWGMRRIADGFRIWPSTRLARVEWERTAGVSAHISRCVAASPQPLFNLSGVVEVQQRCGRISERERAPPWPCALYAKDA
jgi:hypothetical protein